MVEGKFKPVRVNASAAKGIATSLGCAEQTEDTITLLVEWEGVQDPSQRGVGVYTASWAAPMKAGVHVSPIVIPLGSSELQTNRLSICDPPV